jgi:polysaccharide pyruvyl transferase WcaK-like protein
VRLDLDTLVEDNETVSQTLAQFESLVRRADAVISTRLHGLVLTLKNGTPVVAIDPIAGGSKITAQAKTLGWPILFNGNDLTPDDLHNAVTACIAGRMDTDVKSTQAVALRRLAYMERDFVRHLAMA